MAFADGPTCTERAARDFLEYISENETKFGPIENAAGVRRADKNKSANRGGKKRSLVAPTEAPEGSRPSSVALNETHQFILRSGGDPIIVYGPRHRNNDQGEGSFSGTVKATVERSDPNRLLVTFSGFVYKRHWEEKQEAQQGDEGKDVHSMGRGSRGGEDVEMSPLSPLSSVGEDIL